MQFPSIFGFERCWTWCQQSFTWQKKRCLYPTIQEEDSRWIQKLNIYANHILPMQHYYTVKGKVVGYKDFENMWDYFKAFGLDEVAAERQADIVLTLDGSEFTKCPLFVMSGVKLVDIGCKDPHNGGYKLSP